MTGNDKKEDKGGKDEGGSLTSDDNEDSADAGPDSRLR
jgi:hypothetical protein